MFNAVLRLRRDNDYNYAKIKDTFIPANGEICLVDTAREGLRAVCGDGVHTFGQLSYIGELIVKGYYKDGAFYSDTEFTKEIPGATIKIYIDILTNTMYYYDGINFVTIGGKTSLPTASANISGVMKLYSTTGFNEDGTMTQKAITDELDDKVEITLDTSEELLIFTT
jgi:hypothetical protein